ncbi:MAG TPA: alpha/beta hydrolase [Polyangia bacterium]|nr:alpha/beta hydrolase [Polyangia bacterium]
MPQARVGDLSLEYRSDGPPDAPPLLLIMGTAAPLTMWDDAFCAALSARGFRVIRFDYRDTGRSSRVDAPMPSTIGAMMRAFAEGKLAPPYALEDLADDTVGLLDALGVERAHLVGLSQGAGVAQLVAARASERVTGLTLIATSTAARDVPPPGAETMGVLLSDLPNDRASFIEWNVLMYTKTGGIHPPPDVDWIRRRAERTWDHGWDVAGFLRHLLAVISATDRRPLLARLRLPVTIVQGEADPIFSVAAAEQVVAAIPGARLCLVPGMGHDVAPPFWNAIFAAIGPVTDRASSWPGTPPSCW